MRADVIEKETALICPELSSSNLETPSKRNAVSLYGFPDNRFQALDTTCPSSYLAPATENCWKSFPRSCYLRLINKNP